MDDRIEAERHCVAVLGSLAIFSSAERPFSQPLSVPLSFVSGDHIRDNIELQSKQAGCRNTVHFRDKGCDKGRDKDDAAAARLVPNAQASHRPWAGARAQLRFFRRADPGCIQLARRFDVVPEGHLTIAQRFSVG